MVLDARRSSKTSLLKTEQTLKKTRKANGNITLPHTPHRKLSSPEDTAHGTASPALDLSVMSVPADDVDNFPDLRSRSHAMMMMNLRIEDDGH